MIKFDNIKYKYIRLCTTNRDKDYSCNYTHINLGCKKEIVNYYNKIIQK